MLCRVVKLIYPLMYRALACNLTPCDGRLHPRVSLIMIFANYRVGERVRYASIYECVSFFLSCYCVYYGFLGVETSTNCLAVRQETVFRSLSLHLDDSREQFDKYDGRSIMLIHFV